MEIKQLISSNEALLGKENLEVHKAINMIMKCDVPLGFMRAHVIVILSLLSSTAPKGRYKLAKELCLSETSTRTILRRLQNHGFVSPQTIGTSKKGHLLTQKGFELKELIKTRMNFWGSPINLDTFTLGQVDAAVRMPVSWIKKQYNPLVARDAAILLGAKGCTVVFLTTKGFSVGETIIPDGLTHQFDQYKSELGDIILVGTADSFETARLGAFAAAFTCLRKK